MQVNFQLPVISIEITTSGNKKLNIPRAIILSVRGKGYKIFLFSETKIKNIGQILTPQTFPMAADKG